MEEIHNILTLNTEQKPMFPNVINIGHVSVTLSADGNFIGYADAFEAELKKMKSIYGADGGCVAPILWLILREMKRQVKD